MIQTFYDDTSYFPTVSLETIVSGLANGWASPYLAQLTSATADVPLKLTDIEASWVASLLSLGRVTGAFFGAFCQGKSHAIIYHILLEKCTYISKIRQVKKIYRDL